MKLLLGIIILFFTTGNLKDIAKINNLKEQANEAYLRKDFAVAAEAYQKLVNDFKIEDDNITINLANAYYELNDTTNAYINYNKAVLANDNGIKSQALTQIGVMNYSKQNLNESLTMFKAALKADPKNEAARFNYELVKKKLENQKDKDQNQNKYEDDKVQPSEFAKKLKEQAEKLVLNRKYGEAYNLMMNGLKQDQSVSFYKDFISRINDIIEIER